VAEAALFPSLKRFVVGKPIPSSLAHHERLSRVTGLAVLSSDALSSVAYATEEIVRVLVLAGAAALTYSTPIAFVIAAILAIVVFSYRQTIHAYPTGGGAYIVSKDNLGEMPALVAAGSLLIDYILTVAVSIAAGVAALTSAFPGWHANRVELTLGFVALLMIGNLRGIRESGRIFAIPTYFFIITMLTLIAFGTWRLFSGGVQPLPDVHPVAASQPLALFLLLTAFANGCTAMTGVEAVSNGVPAFQRPEAKNAASTMLIMAGLSITMFLGMTLLSQSYHVLPSEQETVISQLARAIFGARGVAYYTVQAATMAILVLAANTAYADFPRLASILARDGYLPRQFMNQGDRLAFSNGIVGLSVFAGLLLLVFGGDTHALIPLYMIGVFVSFTLSQAGMVIHWRKLRDRGWKTSAAINGFGAVVTGVVLVIVAVTKLFEGAWIVLILIPVVIAVFKSTRTHYDHVAAQITLCGYAPQRRLHNTVIVPVGGLTRPVVEALRYGESLSDDVRAVYVEGQSGETAKIRLEWYMWGGGADLVVLDSPYRSLLEPLLQYIDNVQRQRPEDYVTVVLPEFVPVRWWQHLLHNQRALLIKGALLFRRNTVVTSVPFHLDR
jgi:amino acid transporter